MTLTEELMAQVGRGKPSGSDLERPPKVFIDMEGEFLVAEATSQFQPADSICRTVGGV